MINGDGKDEEEYQLERGAGAGHCGSHLGGADGAGHHQLHELRAAVEGLKIEEWRMMSEESPLSSVNTAEAAILLHVTCYIKVFRKGSARFSVDV